MGSHSVTCHPAEVTFPAFIPAEAGSRFGDLGGMQDRGTAVTAVEVRSPCPRLRELTRLMGSMPAYRYYTARIVASTPSIIFPHSLSGHRCLPAPASYYVTAHLPPPPARTPASRLGLNVNVSVSVNVEFKVTLHEQVRYRGHLTVLKVRVCHTAGHYGEEYDGNMQCRLEVAAELKFTAHQLNWTGLQFANFSVNGQY